MRSALIVGIPREMVGRIRAAVKAGASYRNPWRIEYVPSPRAGVAEIRPREIEQVIQQAGELGGAHVLGVSNQDGGIRKAIGQEIRPYFRFLWLKNSILSKAHTPGAMIGELNAVLEQEEVWGDTIRPVSITSALLLPKVSFTVDRPLESLWEEAEEAGNPVMFKGVARRIEAFRARYWTTPRGRSSVWIDSLQKIFDHTGPRHADAPSPRDFKYSYPIPSGFHYDVTQVDGRPFRIVGYDWKEERISANGYVNVDPHGHLRLAR